MSRILVISNLPIIPATAGNKIRVWTLMNNLRALGHDVWFLGLGLKAAEEKALRDAWGDNLFVIPHVKARDARPRFHAFRRWVMDRVIARGWATPDVDYRFWPHWDGAVRQIATREKFDVVIAEYVFCSKALTHFDSTVKVIDTHDVFTDRAKKLSASNIKSYDWSLPREEERLGLLRADVIIAIQKHEAAFFEELTGGSRRIVTIGHTVTLRPLPAPASAARAMLFVGTGNGPNIAGIQHFISRVFPLVREKLPDARLLIAGAICEKIAGKSPGVELLGIVDNLDDAYSAANIVINPLLAGTGLKTKTVEALGHSKPLVTTKCGAEGIEDMAGHAFLMADDPAAMAGQICHLMEDAGAAASLAARGYLFATAWNQAQLDVLGRIDQPAEGSPPARGRTEIDAFGDVPQAIRDNGGGIATK
jgi:glycosyltransferase involved in cell wall biosynthesis